MTEFVVSMPTGVLIVNLLIMFGIGASAVIIWRRVLRRARKRWGRILVKAIIGAAVVGFAYVFFIAPSQTNVIIDDTISVNTPPYAKAVIQREDIINVYVADWATDGELEPARRTNGTAMGNYRLGKFKLKNGESAIIMANSTRVLCIELEDKYLLLAPDNFEEFTAKIAEFTGREL